MIPIQSLGPGYWEDCSPTLTDDQLLKRLRSVAYGCANRNSTSVAGTPRKLFVRKSADKFDEVLDHPILNILNKPNIKMSGYTFLELTQLYLECTGKAYWRIVNNVFGLPAELWVLQSNMVSTEIDNSGYIKQFNYSNGSKSYKLSPSEVIDIYDCDLNNPYQTGTGPMQRASEHVHQLYLTREHQIALLENKSEIAAIMSPKPDAVISETMMERLISVFRKKHRRNSGGIAGFAHPVDITPVSFNSRDSAHLEFYQEARKDICFVFGVPNALMESQKSRAEVEASMVSYGRFAINPRNKRLDDALTNRICSLFNPNLYIKSDDAVPEDTTSKITAEAALINAGIISPDEARQRLGIEGKAPVKPEPKAPGAFGNG